MKSPRGLRAIAFLGGGTGGHLIPGIALAERARVRFPGCRTLFFRTSRGVEDRVFAGRGLESVALRLQSPGSTVKGWLRYSLASVAAEQQIRRELACGFDAAFGLGGYASLPGILAAKSLGIPVILLEQNRVPGRVNSLLAPLADLVACPFPSTRLAPLVRCEVTGNPVRSEIVQGAARRAARPRSEDTKTLLVAGGSQGSKAINDWIRGALEEILEFREGIYWIHVAGDADKEAMTEAYRSAGFRAEVHSFTHDLPELMSQSDLFIGRSGGTTLSELAVLGLPSVLVPYPHHRDQHQLRNAEVLRDGGGAEILEESRLGPGSLRRVIEDFLLAPDRLESMGRSARLLSRPDAADAVLDLAVELQERCPPAFVSSS